MKRRRPKACDQQVIMIHQNTVRRRIGFSLINAARPLAQLGLSLHVLALELLRLSM